MTTYTAPLYASTVPYHFYKQLRHGNFPFTNCPSSIAFEQGQKPTKLARICCLFKGPHQGRQGQAIMMRQRIISHSFVMCYPIYKVYTGIFIRLALFFRGCPYRSQCCRPTVCSATPASRSVAAARQPPYVLLSRIP